MIKTMIPEWKRKNLLTEKKLGKNAYSYIKINWWRNDMLISILFNNLFLYVLLM